MPVSTVLHDYHGIDGVALSVPSVVDAAGAPRSADAVLAERARPHAPVRRRAARGRRLAALSPARRGEIVTHDPSRAAGSSAILALPEHSLALRSHHERSSPGSPRHRDRRPGERARPAGCSSSASDPAATSSPTAEAGIAADTQAALQAVLDDTRALAGFPGVIARSSRRTARGPGHRAAQVPTPTSRRRRPTSHASAASRRP